jgi:coenzyme Q-binding protein COQ10
MPGAKLSIDLTVPPSALYAIITDQERYPEFLPEIKRARVLERSATHALVEYEIEILKKVNYTLRFALEQDRRVQWSLVSSNMLKTNNGGWDLEALPNGGCRATYHLDVSIGGFVPGALVEKLTGKTLPATMESFKRRAEALHRA